MIETIELDDAVYQKVTSLTASGKQREDAGQYPEAIEHYAAALKLIPEPITDWEASLWLLAAIGDAHFHMGNYEQALLSLSDAIHCPGALGNPFLHLRLGQVQFQLENRDRAADELTRAYMGAGAEIFQSEDPVYFAFLKSRITL